MRKLLIALFVFTLPLCAGTIWLGTFPGNDSEADVEAALLSVGYSVDVTLYDKSGDPPVLTLFTPSPPEATMEGTWAVIDEGVEISLVSVKAGPDFALYWYDPAVNSGDWTTAELTNPGGNQPGLSHISLWTAPIAQIPEPGTWLMMGAGLLSLGVLRRRRRP